MLKKKFPCPLILKIRIDADYIKTMSYSYVLKDFPMYFLHIQPLMLF